MEELTARQKEILHLIREHTATSGFPPTRADICRVMGFKSPNAAEEHLRVAVRERQNILVAGGTSSGKTSLSNALLAEVTGSGDRGTIWASPSAASGSLQVQRTMSQPAAASA